MARNTRSPKLETRTARLKLPGRWKPYTVRIGPGVRLAYRRNATAGSWSVIAADGKGGSWLKVFAGADDHQDANGDTVLNFWQAQERARTLARGDNEAAASDSKPVTVGEALNQYAADLEARGGDVANVARVRIHLSQASRDKAVALLAAWRYSPRSDLFLDWKIGF